jgi:hypothetical protein
MIYIFNGEKFKVKKYKTSDELIKGLTIEYQDQKNCQDNEIWSGFSIDNRKEFDKRINKGLDVYCCVDFYEPGYSNRETIYWFNTPEETENFYFQMIDNV